jgi:hypothetical protein
MMLWVVSHENSSESGISIFIQRETDDDVSSAAEWQTARQISRAVWVPGNRLRSNARNVAVNDWSGAYEAVMLVNSLLAAAEVSAVAFIGLVNIAEHPPHEKD